MSPHDMDKYREVFEASCHKLGWHCKEVRVEHERDWDCSWTVQVWCRSDGTRLIAEGDLSEALVQEIIRIAGMING